MSTKRNYDVVQIGRIADISRTVLNETLALTGSEVSINQLPSSGSIPFVHTHKENEEVYLILSGDGVFYIDGEEFPVTEGSIIRVDPSGERCMKAGSNGPLRFICIQAKANSLKQHTRNDGQIQGTKPSWLN